MVIAGEFDRRAEGCGSVARCKNWRDVNQIVGADREAARVWHYLEMQSQDYSMLRATC